MITTQDEFPSGTLPWLQRGNPVQFLATGNEGAISPKAIGEAVEPESQQQIDVLVFGGYKWATTGYGIAVLYIRKELLATKALPMVGWRSARVPYALVNDRLDLETHTTALELGHPLFPVIFALGGALRLFEEIGVYAIEERVQELTAYLHERLEAQGVAILSTTDAAHRSGITMLDASDPQQVVNELEAQGILVAARRSGVRVSMHLYNNRDDVDRFAEALARVH